MKLWIAYHMPSLDVSVRWPSAKRRLSSPPNLGGGLTSARCELDTPQCLTACRWQVRSKILRGEVFVPPRTKAELSLPGQPASKFLPGRQIEKIMNIRKAFVMSVNAGAEQEYEKRHNPIWPELERLLNEWCRCE